MIICKQLRKLYGSQKVFEKFSYTFNETGFYLLFGESGSGKTTLLNMLAGHVAFDGGVVDFNGKEYTHQVKANDIKYMVDYITQDANFIEYLSVYDNLALCCTDDKLIEEYLVKFGLMDKKDMLPAKLSGGEKQRICLIRSLIQQKKIILLDEPTASLDKKNKKMVFEMLQKLKESVLIICSSHDEIAKEYADESIDFNNLKSYERELSIGEVEERSTENTTFAEGRQKSSKRKRVGKYIRKWFNSSYKEKGSKIKLCIVMILALMAICMGDTPGNKFRSSIEYIYGLNQLTLWIEADKLDYMDTLYAREDIEEIVMQYDGSVPYEEDGVMVSADYELIPWTLPENQESLHISDYLAYGRYIENEDEIILSDAMAERMGNPEELIGQKIEKKLYGGISEVTIVGIFGELTDIQKEYLQNSRIWVYDEKDLYDDMYAVGAKYTNKYLDDEKFIAPLDGGQRCYIVYFKSYSDMMSFYEKNEKTYDKGYMFTPPSVDLSTEHVFSVMHQYMMPVAALIMILAVVFYFQTQKTELMYNMKIFAVYQYLGYSMIRVKATWIIYSIFEIVKAFVVSGIISVILTVIVNRINRQQKLIPFEIFTYNTEYIVWLLVAVVGVGALNAFFMLRRINPKNISKNLVEQRDIL